MYMTHQLPTSYLPVTVRIPAHLFDMLFAPWALAFDFSSDLDISAQGQAMIVLFNFIRMH